MTDKRFIEDAYLKRLNTEVIDVRTGDTPCFTVKETVFYAMSGGQPGDTGSVINSAGDEIAITDTRYDSDRQTIVHYIAADNAGKLRSGEAVTLMINWPRRHRLMRMHSAMHLLCSLIPYPVTGGGVGETESRVEFDMSTGDFDKEELSRQLTELTERAIDIETSWITDDELDQNPELVRTMSVQPPRGTGRIRMVKIGDHVDYQPCGGTHVKNTTEIGPLQVTKIKSKGKQNKRVSIALAAP
ncbi:MAG: alanyl-tRNA editing protein [Reinekea sp.]|jgi:misacylated tRNA(Ala) deacylase